MSKDPFLLPMAAAFSPIIGLNLILQRDYSSGLKVLAASPILCPIGIVLATLVYPPVIAYALYQFLTDDETGDHGRIGILPETNENKLETNPLLGIKPHELHTEIDKNIQHMQDSVVDLL